MVHFFKTMDGTMYQAGRLRTKCSFDMVRSYSIASVYSYLAERPCMCVIDAGMYMCAFDAGMYMCAFDAGMCRRVIDVGMCIGKLIEEEDR